MQPLSPRVRVALKAAHPGLTDEIIDRAEALLRLQAQVDPERQAGRARELGQERARLLGTHMPRYAEVLRQVRPDRADAGWPSVTGAPGEARAAAGTGAGTPPATEARPTGPGKPAAKRPEPEPPRARIPAGREAPPRPRPSRSASPPQGGGRGRHRRRRRG